MKKFNSVVLSKTEPGTESIWVQPDKSVWAFDNGWHKIVAENPQLDSKVNKLLNRIEVVEGIIDVNHDGAINKFNEIIDFLDGIEDDGLTLKEYIYYDPEKQDTISFYEINDANAIPINSLMNGAIYSVIDDGGQLVGKLLVTTNKSGEYVYVAIGNFETEYTNLLQEESELSAGILALSNSFNICVTAFNETTGALEWKGWQKPLYDEVTYDYLKQLKIRGLLIPGQKYRMIDYKFTTTQDETSSANHPFDLIFEAVSNNAFNTVVTALPKDGDDYFRHCDLSQWVIHYDFDNNQDLYYWADPVNGKGVITYMKDDRGNECYYDFKNALFKRYWVTEFDETIYTREGVNNENYNTNGWLYQGNRNHRYLAFQGFEPIGTTIDWNRWEWCYTFSCMSILSLDTTKHTYTMGPPFLDGTVQTENNFDSPAYTGTAESNDEDNFWRVHDNVIMYYKTAVNVDGEEKSVQLLNNVVITGHYAIDDNRSGFQDNKFTDRCNNMTFRVYYAENCRFNQCSNYILFNSSWRSTSNIHINSWGTEVCACAIDELVNNGCVRYSIFGNVWKTDSDNGNRDISYSIFKGECRFKMSGNIVYFNRDSKKMRECEQVDITDDTEIIQIEQWYNLNQNISNCKINQYKVQATSTAPIQNMDIVIRGSGSVEIPVNPNPNGSFKYIFHKPSNPATTNMISLDISKILADKTLELQANE